jgi:hypothetical protein
MRGKRNETKRDMRSNFFNERLGADQQ